MSFATLKASLLAASKPLQICEAFHAVAIAADYSALIEAGLKVAVWAYQSGVIDDAKLAEIPETDLNDKGIYTTGSVSLTDPYYSEIYLYKDVDLTLTLTGPTSLKVIMQGAATLTANLESTAHLDLKMYNDCEATITADDESSVCADISNNASYTATLNDDSTGHLVTRSEVTATVNGANNAVARIIAYNQSVVSFTQADSSVFYNQAFNNAVITDIT